MIKIVGIVLKTSLKYLFQQRFVGSNKLMKGKKDEYRQCGSGFFG